jgi:superfamily II DNA or RNA helicase
MQLDSSSIWVEVTGSPTAVDHFEDKLSGLIRQELSGSSGKAMLPMLRKSARHLRVLAGLLPLAAPAVELPRVWDGDVDELERRMGVLVGCGWRDYQLEAVRAAVTAPMGRGHLEVGTGGGKTRIAAGIAWVAGGHWLYVVHGRDLVRQARESFAELRSLLNGHPPPRGSTDGWGLNIECFTWGTVPDRMYSPAVDGLLVDECHQCPARTRASVISRFRGGWRIGMSGTPLDRTDERNCLVVGLLGPSLQKVTVAELTDRGALTPGKVVVVNL